MSEIKLVIVTDERGGIKVEGPIDNKLLAFGMLECAKDAIVRHHQQKDSNRIVAAAMMPDGIPGVRRAG